MTARTLGQHGSARPARTLTAAALALGCGLLLLVAPSTASAAPAPDARGGLIHGTLHSSAGAENVVGVTVRVREAGTGGPGAVVDTTTTDGAGDFALNGTLASTQKVYVEVLGAVRWQGGLVGGDPKFAQFADPSAADRYGKTEQLGEILVVPAYMRGRVVRAGTSQPVQGAGVRVFSVPENQLLASTTTGAQGRFSLSGLSGEEFSVRIIGPSGYEKGWVGCNLGVVATQGQSCSQSSGQFPGPIRLDAV